MRRKDASARIQRIKGEYSGKGLRFGIVVSDFNEYLTRQLCDGAVDTLLRHGAAPKSVRIAHVPGAFEIPLASAKLIRSFKPHAVVTLAVVMRGKTRWRQRPFMSSHSSCGFRNSRSKYECPGVDP